MLRVVFLAIALVLSGVLLAGPLTGTGLAGQRTNFSSWKVPRVKPAAQQPPRRVQRAPRTRNDWRRAKAVRTRLRQVPSGQQNHLFKRPQRQNDLRKRAERQRTRNRKRRSRIEVPHTPAKPKFFAYKPERLVPVRNRKLAGEPADTALARAVFAVLKDGSKKRLRAEKDERAAVLSFYTGRNFEPLWLSEEGLNARGQNLLETLERAPEHALTAARYLPSALKTFAEVPATIFEDSKRSAELEVGLTIKALKFARHASGGQLRPDRIGPNYDLPERHVDPTVALTSLAAFERPQTYLDSLHPSHPLYAQLKARLNGTKLKKKSGTKTAQILIPGGSMLSSGSKGSRVGLLRKRLTTLGFLKDGSGVENTFDKDVDAAVRKFQKSKGLWADGLVGKRTLAALNGKKTVKVKREDPRVPQKLAINMERLRWLPDNLGARHVIVNQAAYQGQVIADGEKIHQMRVIIGKPKHPTPLFSDEMETVVFNPYWYIPRSILASKLRRGGYSLDRRGYEVINWKGKRIRSSRVKWGRYSTKNLPYTVRQKPGPGNALGQIKFLFPNKHAVYMHDTPSKGLFHSKRRAYSHGCVRVQDPKKFAEVILGWNAKRVKSAINAKKNRPVKLEEKIPVHLTYLTLWADDDGDLAVHEDVYGRDAAVKRALEKTRRAWGGRVPAKVATKSRKKKSKKWRQSSLQ